jgi:proteasome lid subunit RPN8/RPN11
LFDELLSLPWSSRREHAVWAFGRVFADGLEIHHFDGWVEGETDSVLIPRDDQLEREYADRGFPLIGHCHSHWDGDPQPSTADRETWVRLSRSLRRPAVGLLLLASSPGASFPYADPDLRAFVAANDAIRRDGLITELEELTNAWFG